MGTYRVPTYNLPALHAKLERIERRAKRLGVALPTWTTSEPFAVKTGTDDSGDIFTECVTIEVTGDAPKYAGWTLAAVLEPLGEENMVARVPGCDAKLPESYAQVTGQCDHCHAKRRRDQTFAVVHDDGRVAQVGRDCLGDFLGGESPDKVAGLAACMIALGAAMEESEGYGGGGGRESDVATLDAYLPWVAQSIRVAGWLSRAKAREEGRVATADDAFLRWHRIGGYRQEPPPDPNEADKAKAVAAIEWASTLDASREETGSYLANVATIGRAGYATSKCLGVAASILVAHDHALAKAREAAEQRKSVHVGAVGERVECAMTVHRVFAFDSQYGVNYRVILKDDAGNVFAWKASSPKAGDLEPGTRYMATGTIKAHDDYKGIAQTVLTRCEVITFEEVAERAARLAAVRESECKLSPAVRRRLVLAFVTTFVEAILAGNAQEAARAAADAAVADASKRYDAEQVTKALADVVTGASSATVVNIVSQLSKEWRWRDAMSCSPDDRIAFATKSALSFGYRQQCFKPYFDVIAKMTSVWATSTAVAS